MSYQISATQNLGNPITVTGLIQLASAGTTTYDFGQLGNPPNTTNLGVRDSDGLVVGEAAQVVRSSVLISCASTIWVDQNGRAYVYHANAGSVPAGVFQNAIAFLGAAGPPYNTVYIAFAHPNTTDPGYQGTVTDFVNWGVPTNNIIEISNLFLPQFGINNLLQLGY